MGAIKMIIISGGQTGADQGALVAAKQLGISTGGWMPRGFLTEDGPCPDLGPLYNLREHPSVAYPARTRQNVRDSEGTVWVGDDVSRPLDDPSRDSAGLRCTRREAGKLDKPFIKNPTANELREWVRRYNIGILNVAGPRASRDPKAHRRAAELIHEAFGKSNV
jgi:hypothetical protein